jgi:ABC-type transport system involved in cytochrome c biogenesis ATPase subunit
VGLDNASLKSLGAAITRHRDGGGRVAAATHVPLPVDGSEQLRLDDFSGGPEMELAW